MDLGQTLKPIEPDLVALNDSIRLALNSNVPLIEQIGDHIISGGGKRLRPIIALLAARALGYDQSEQAHVQVAAVVEFLHTSTLLHDDVVDNSHTRRSRPTANQKWGNAAPVLVGDFLLSRAFQMITNLGRMPLMRCLADATVVIAEGEVLQLVHLGQLDLSEQTYFQIIHHKTAKMFETAAELGALLSPVEPRQLQAIKQYALSLGMAFQLVDDALDYQGQSDIMGKNLGDDLREGKITLPLIHALANLPALEHNTLTAIINKARQGEYDRTLDSTDIDRVRELLKLTKSLEYTLEQARTATHQALDALDNLSPNQFVECLAQLAELSLSRSN